MASWHDILPWQTLQQCREYEFTLPTTGPDSDDALEGFVICHEQRDYAYHNCCPHQQVFLNWSPNQFYDREQAFLVCSTHGALFRPDNGLCVQGPCTGQTLSPLDTRIEGGQVQVFIL